MTMFVSGSTLEGMKRLLYKYGAAAIVVLINYLLLSPLISQYVMIPVMSAINSSAGENAADIMYAFVMLMNCVISYLVPTLALILLFREDMPDKDAILPFRSDDEYKRFPGETIIIIIAGMWAAMMGGYATTLISRLLNDLFSVPETHIAFSGLMPANAFQYVSFELSSIIIAPVCEEIIYRHFFVKPLRKYGDTAAVLVSALYFGLMHFNLDQFLYAFLFGFFLGVIAVRSGSVIPCIICHVINNLIVGVKVYLPETLGNETADAVFAGIGDVFSNIQLGVFYVGALALIAAILLKLLRFRSAAGISGGSQLKTVFTNPMLLIGLVVCLAVSIMNLYK